MSTIERMGIRGIRSFGPDSGDFQQVKFFKPVTLIQGPNGSGKTTIIECLKYATTGDMPPGSKTAGAAFVHDPKLAKEREIKGQIKLMICDVTGSKCIVERSMTSRVKDGKGKKLELKTLDGVLTRVNAEGEKNSITSRCADLNREMIGALGVSKAVLENVIFCHQEDSNWPLSEGKVLKDKFDAIFASTRYTRALEELRKVKQAQDIEIREGRKELDYLRQHKQKAEQFQADLEEHKAELAASMEKVGKINEQLEPIREKLRSIDEQYGEICDLKAKKQEYASKKDHISKSMDRLRENISEDFKGTTSQLKKALSEFSSKVQEKQEELQDYEQQQRALTAELEKLAKEESSLLMEVGKLQNEADVHDENIRKRDAKIRELAQLYQFEEFEQVTTISDSLYQTFFQKMKEKLESMMDQARARKAEFEESQKQLQIKIDGLKENKTRLEHSEKMKSQNIAKNNNELKDLTKKLNQMAISSEKLSGLTTQLRRAEDDLLEAQSSLNVEEVKTEIASLDRQKKQLASEISDLNEEIKKQQKHSSVQTELNFLIENQKEKEASIARLRAEHEDSIVSLLGHFPVDNLRECVSVYISNQTETVRKCRGELTALNNQLSAKEAERSHCKEIIKQKEEEIRGLEAKIADVCDGQDLDQEITEVKRNLTQAQEERGSLLGAEHMINKYIKNLETNNPSCPLCKRGFQQAQEVRELILKLQEQQRKVPANLRKADEDVKQFQRKHDAIVQLEPVRESLVSVKDKELPNLRSKLKKLDEDIKKMKDEVHSKEDDVSIQESDLTTAKNFEPDVVDMDRRRGEVKELDRKIEAQKALLSGAATHQSLDEMTEERDNKQHNLDTVSRNFDRWRDKLAEFQEKTLRLGSKVNKLKEEKLSIEGQLIQKTKLEERKASLVSENKNFQREIDEGKVQIKPLDEQIEKLVDEKREVVSTMDCVLDAARTDVEDVKNKGNYVRDLNNEMKKYLRSGKSEKLKKNHERKCQLAATRASKEEEQEEVNATIRRVNTEISSQQLRERELQDMLQLRNFLEEVKNLDVKMMELEEKLGGLDTNNLMQERQKLVRKDSSLREELHKAMGRQQGFQDQIKATQRELDSDMYKNAHNKYTSMVIQNKTVEIASGDVQRYYGAMDKAIMMYHKSKMDEINNIIRDLWRTTYAGHDIETIEIQSEADDAAAPTSTIKNRRNYNYRVVMIRNGIPFDMRGRCSAGQKVLASLIIRLALAETFCINCGVLALDEPTTNLDRRNIENLAFSLVKIIKERSNQRHFQLVVITHDEDFVELLGRSEFVDEYIHVSKNMEGLSRLKIKRVEELHT